MFQVTHIGQYLCNHTFARSVEFNSTMSHWLVFKCLISGQRRAMAFIVLPASHSLRWRLVSKVIKSFQGCDCSQTAELFLSKSPVSEQSDQRVSMETILANIEEDDQEKELIDLDVSKISFIQGREDLCLLCSRREVVPWNHFHGDLHLLEIVHKDIQWVCMGQHKFYTGWIEVKRLGRRHSAVLYEMNLQRGVVSFVMGQFAMTDAGQERYRIVTPPTCLDPSFIELFKASRHRPIPRLTHITLEIIFQRDLLYVQLPETLKEHFSELKLWMSYFPRGKFR